ncbi:MAG: hypothetical protein HOJ90_15510 [Alphaproteobacteria bacterium]|nr:hypothetical protein [Alphaproteobacteria bacterium]
MPALAALAREAGDTLTRPVLDADGQAVDIDLGESRFYNRPVVNIDDPIELELAEWLLERQQRTTSDLPAAQFA